MIVFFIILMAIFGTVLKFPKAKGWFGELLVKLYLNKLKQPEYYTLHNILLETGENKTSQIDHIVISVYGIFLIETKHYKGIITGNDKDQFWIQHLGWNQYQFYNPVKQNAGHIRALKKILKDQYIPKYISIICFSSFTNLKATSNTPVIHLSSLLKTIQMYKYKVMKAEDVKMFYHLIKSANRNNPKAIKMHIERIKRKMI
jgi:hypothetical protein